MKIDREALVSPKLLAGGGVLLAGFGLIVWLYMSAHHSGDQLIELLQQTTAGGDPARIESLLKQRAGAHQMLLVAMSLFALLIFIVALAVSQSLIGPLRRTIEYTDRIASGELGSRATYWASGEVANVREAVSDMQEQLTEVVVQVSGAARRVEDEATQIANSSRSLRRHFDEQAGSLERVTGKMKEIAGSLRHQADDAERIESLVSKTHTSIKNGGEIVKQTVAAMEEIHASSSEISDIIGIIDDIAFQTNLLALNAAVEAARSGEHGRGFAVVATEVRNLAQRSAEAASQIKSLIGESVSKVEEGSRLAVKSGETLSEIQVRFDEVTACVMALLEKTDQDARHVDAIVTDVHEVEQLMATGRDLVAAVSASGESVESSSRGLNQAVGYFKIDAEDADALRAATRSRGREPVSKPGGMSALRKRHAA